MLRACFAPTRCPAATESALRQLLIPGISRDLFVPGIRRIRERFRVYTSTTPAPLPSAGLIMTPEIRLQCEMYLPIEEIRGLFDRLFRSALTYPPLLTNTPFCHASCWADVFRSLPHRFQLSADPSRLLEALLGDREQLIRFLFATFLPDRFYGGFRRYPDQLEWLRRWLESRPQRQVRCLDAACGTGEGTWDLVRLLNDSSHEPGACFIEGWTIEPLELWAAAYGCFPHDSIREAEYRQATDGLIADGWNMRMLFSCSDLKDDQAPAVPEQRRFDLIVCNGLLGGPIIHEPSEMARVVAYLSGLLASGGVLLAANYFHAGWEKKCPQKAVRQLFENSGLTVVEAGEGICGASA